MIYCTGMKHASKEFSQSLHDSFDDSGRQAVKDHYRMTKPHLTVTDNPNKYGVDLQVFDGENLIGYIEVEVRTNWKTEHFPFNTLHVPERKGKLLRNDLPTKFVSINQQLTHMYSCWADTVLNAHKSKVPNKYVSNNEYFYDVPVNKLQKTKLEKPGTYE